MYDCGGLRVGIIEKRSKSLDGCDRVEGRVRRLEEQAKVDLAVWSNIMWSVCGKMGGKDVVGEARDGKENMCGMSNMLENVS